MRMPTRSLRDGGAPGQFWLLFWVRDLLCDTCHVSFGVARKAIFQQAREAAEAEKPAKDVRETEGPWPVRCARCLTYIGVTTKPEEKEALLGLLCGTAERCEWVRFEFSLFREAHAFENGDVFFCTHHDGKCGETMHTLRSRPTPVSQPTTP